jgi:hypothetical protein
MRQVQLLEVGSKPTKYESVVLEFTCDDQIESFGFYDLSFFELSDQVRHVMSSDSQKFSNSFLLVCDDLSASHFQTKKVNISDVSITREQITDEDREKVDKSFGGRRRRIPVDWDSDE